MTPVAPRSKAIDDVPPGWGELLAGIGSAAGYVVAVAVLLLIVVALIRGDLAPGWALKAETKRADKAEDRLNARATADDAAAAAASVAERAAIAVASQIQRLQRAGNAARDPDEPT